MRLLRRTPDGRLVVPLPLREPVGLGDAVHRLTQALGVPECGGCAQRRAALNRAAVVGRPRLLRSASSDRRR
jgi:hypothetical protein